MLTKEEEIKNKVDTGRDNHDMHQNCISLPTLAHKFCGVIPISTNFHPEGY